MDTRSRRKHSLLYMLPLVLIVNLVAVACSGDATTEDAAQPETIAISGAFALFPMVTLWADEYKQDHPNVQFDIQAGGAGKGMTDVLAGAVDVAMVSRDIRREEKDQGAYGIPVTIDAVVGTFNADNPYRAEIERQGITAEDVARIWLTGEYKTWGDLLGNGASDPINVYTRADAAGAAEMWARFAGGTAQEELLGTAVNADPGLAEAVRNDPLGIGFNNIGFAYDLSTGKATEGLAVIPIDLNGDGQINAEEAFYGTKAEIAAAIGARIFPFPPARELYLVTKGKPGPAVVSFITYILNEGQALVAPAGYVALDAAKLEAARELLK